MGGAGNAITNQDADTNRDAEQAWEARHATWNVIRGMGHPHVCKGMHIGDARYADLGAWGHGRRLGVESHKKS
jgi:hypothetical protein